MTLEEYEKMREEKRAGLNKKPSTEVKADPKAFEGMKLARKVEDENELELSNKKQIGQRKSGQVDKTRKEVWPRTGERHLAFATILPPLVFNVLFIGIAREAVDLDLWS